MFPQILLEADILLSTCTFSLLQIEFDEPGNIMQQFTNCVKGEENIFFFTFHQAQLYDCHISLVSYFLLLLCLHVCRYLLLCMACALS